VTKKARGTNGGTIVGAIPPLALTAPLPAVPLPR
jgi:hypothetical protein